MKLLAIWPRLRNQLGIKTIIRLVGIVAGISGRFIRPDGLNPSTTVKRLSIARLIQKLYPHPVSDYKDSHRRLRKFMRDFVDREIMPYADAWEEAGEKRREYCPRSFVQALGAAGILRSIPGPAGWTKEVSALPGVPALPAGISEDEFDIFHEQIIWTELLRCGYPGIIAGGTTGIAVGLPVLMNYGSNEIKQKVVPAALRGDVSLSLAVTEPHAGSDIQGLQTTARLSDDGKHFIVNGEKVAL